VNLWSLTALVDSVDGKGQKISIDGVVPIKYCLRIIISSPIYCYVMNQCLNWMLSWRSRQKLSAPVVSSTLLVTLGCLTGCTPVKPWEKGDLAKDIMSFDGSAAEVRTRRHMYQAKEGSGGGYGASVGACGCN
jgi:hypothetical protein